MSALDEVVVAPIGSLRQQSDSSSEGNGSNGIDMTLALRVLSSPLADAHEKSKSILRNMQEEANLLYVAVTRAKQRLWLSSDLTEFVLQSGGWLHPVLGMDESVQPDALNSDAGAAASASTNTNVLGQGSQPGLPSPVAMVGPLGVSGYLSRAWCRWFLPGHLGSIMHECPQDAKDGPNET